MKYHSDKKLLDKYSRDRSIYQIRPSFVAFPRTEKDVIEITKYARRNKLSIVPRGGGTDLSGASIGTGVVVDFSRYFTKVYELGAITRVQAGILLKKLKPLVEKTGYMLPSVPWHGECAIGGNVNTRSVGPRTLKYGLMDKQVKSLRGVLSDGRILDTSKKIPGDIKYNVLELGKKIKKEGHLIKYLKKRPFVGGGYNLKALIENKNINDTITNLIVGSTGTLMLMTEVVLKLPKYKELKSLYFLHFKDFDSLQGVLNKFLKLKPAMVEYLGKEVLELCDKRYQCDGSVAALIVGFESKKNVKKIAKGSIDWRQIPFDKRSHLWESRASALPKLEKRARELGLHLPSSIDDTTFDTRYFSRIMRDVKKYEKKSGIEIASFGHIGVGSLHLRPFIDITKNPRLFDRLGMDIFRIVRRYGGTLIGEHNSGFCRSRYLEMESKKMYTYMKKVKNVFDPDNILNPKVIFNLDPITKNLKPE